jgi:hypothetical protein
VIICAGFSNLKILLGLLNDINITILTSGDFCATNSFFNLIYLYLKQTEFNVHKLVLTINSDVFRAMFSHKNTKECQESRIVIGDSTARTVRQMLIYIYTDDLPTEYARETDAVPLLYIGNKYQIKPLVQLIERGLVKRFTSKFRLRGNSCWSSMGTFFLCWGI